VSFIFYSLKKELIFFKLKCMKKLLLFPAVLLGSCAIFSSCSKRSDVQTVAPVNNNVIEATIAPNGTYSLPTNNLETVRISMQASHYKVSEAKQDGKTGITVYKYIPAADYIGTDQVILNKVKIISTSPGSGCSNNHTSNPDNTVTSSYYVTVKINISN
jgi:hypothetical protein